MHQQYCPSHIRRARSTMWPEYHCLDANTSLQSQSTHYLPPPLMYTPSRPLSRPSKKTLPTPPQNRSQQLRKPKITNQRPRLTNQNLLPNHPASRCPCCNPPLRNNASHQQRMLVGRCHAPQQQAPCALPVPGQYAPGQHFMQHPSPLTPVLTSPYSAARPPAGQQSPQPPPHPALAAPPHSHSPAGTTSCRHAPQPAGHPPAPRAPPCLAR